MPVTLDTYSRCGFDCLYCFGLYQKLHHVANKAVESVNPDKVKRLFLGEDKTRVGQQMTPLIKARRAVQWGGLADAFDPYEEKLGVSLELLRFFRQQRYPVSISTKGTFFVNDDRYRAVLKDADNFHFKVSIINLDPGRAAGIERGVSSPQERLRTISELRRLGVAGVTLRLRPFIPFVTDRDDEWIALIRLAAEAGADSVSTEFYCYELRADERLKKRYAEMNAVARHDLGAFYKLHSHQNGYLRLNRALKLPILTRMREVCEQAGMRFYVSDAHGKELSYHGSCCGIPPTWEFSEGQFTQALVIARERGRVTWADMEPHLQQYREFAWEDAIGYNTGTAQRRDKALGYANTMYGWIKGHWNDTEKASSPAVYFGGALKPDGFDAEGNVIYRYAGAATPPACMGCALLGSGCSSRRP